MDGLLKCNGCLVKYSDELIPRLLSCGHSLCTACVQKFTEDQGSCPECNQKEPMKSLEEYAINYPLLRFFRSLTIKDVDVKRDSLTLSKVFSNSEHKGAWCCGVHRSPICLFCYACTSWVCQDCLVIDHSLPPRGSCRVIEFVDALKKIKCKYKEVADETLKDIESIKENFDMAIHDFCLMHCTKERSHLRIIERIEDLTEGERESNELVVQDARKRLQELTDSDITTSQENFMSSIRALTSFKEELAGIISEEKERLSSAMPVMLKHLRLDLKRLAWSTKPLYAIANEGEEAMFARIMVKDQRLLVYSLQKGRPSEDCVIVPYSFVKKLIPIHCSTVFFEIGTAEEFFGRVYTLMYLNMDDFLHLKQMLLMCTGEHGVSYRNSSFFKYEESGLLRGGDHEKNDGTGGKTTIEGLGDCCTVTLYEEQKKRGTLACSPLSTRFTFHLKDHKDIVECCVGKVHDGLEILKAVSKLEPVTKAVVKDCGVVIPMEPRYSSERHCMESDDDL